MAMIEYAWTSFNQNAKIFDCQPMGTAEDPRFHPTQKPVELYRWLLSKYAKPGDKILDTHAGSASSLIACREMGFEYTGFEINEGYYREASERLAKAENQITMFDVMKGENHEPTGKTEQNNHMPRMRQTDCLYQKRKR